MAARHRLRANSSSRCPTQRHSSPGPALPGTRRQPRQLVDGHARSVVSSRLSLAACAERCRWQGSRRACASLVSSQRAPRAAAGGAAAASKLLSAPHSGASSLRPRHGLDSFRVHRCQSSSSTLLTRSFALLAAGFAPRKDGHGCWRSPGGRCRLEHVTGTAERLVWVGCAPGRDGCASRYARSGTSCVRRCISAANRPMACVARTEWAVSQAVPTYVGSPSARSL